MGGVLFAVGGFRAPYQVFIGVPVVWFGVFFGVGRAFASLILAYSGKIQKRMTIYSFYLLRLILFAVLIFALGITAMPWIIVALFIIINAFQWGLSQIGSGFLLNVIKTSKFKATLLSTQSQINEAVAAIAGFGLGYMIERFSYQTGFLYLGIVFLAVLVPLYWYIIQSRKIIKIA